jgi:putative ABC transport system substrate-binding protein
MHFHRLKRREFIAVLGGTAAAWPIGAQAQQMALPVIGFLNSQSPDPSAERLRGFRQGLKDSGYVEGENIGIEYRWADNQLDRLPALADELVHRQVTIIVTTGGHLPAFAVKRATASIPIVFVVAEDPVKLGLVASLARPGGNLTGINFFSVELTAKRLGLLRELVPATARVAVLVNPADVRNTQTTLRDVEAAAHGMALQIQVLNASTSREIDAAFAMFVRDRPDALFVGPDPFFLSRRMQFALLAARYAVPATYQGRDYADAGGLMSYGTSLTDAYRQAGVHAGRILKGMKPADLPVLQSSKFELVVNLQAAKAIGLDVPAQLIARADEVIE